MRNEPVTMNEFANSVRQDLQDNLEILFPGIKVEVQMVDKIQGEHDIAGKEVSAYA